MNNSALGDVFKLPQQSGRQAANIPAGADGVWDATSYAAGLVKTDQIDFNPKLKFLFKVSFEFDPSVAEAASDMGYDLRKIKEGVSFTVTRIDRPKWDFEYEEVNMYNYRTKVLKSIKHREVGFTLYDDVGNSVLDFINIYKKLLQPISRNQTSASMAHPEDFGMEFTSAGRPHYLDTGMRGVLPYNAINVLTKMTVHQIFVERGSKMDNPADWVKVVNFEFYRPRFTSIDIDDMDHENGSNYSLVNFVADFDNVFITDKEGFRADAAPIFPVRDIESTATGAKNPAGGERNAFMDIVANQTSRNGLMGMPLITIAGGGLSSKVGGLLENAAQRTMGGITGLSIPSAPFVKDASVSLSKAKDLASKTSSLA
jgi:hypothetical protein